MKTEGGREGGIIQWVVGVEGGKGEVKDEAEFDGRARKLKEVKEAI